MLTIIWISSAWWSMGWNRRDRIFLRVGAGRFGFMQAKRGVVISVSPGLQFGAIKRTFRWWLTWEEDNIFRELDIPTWTLVALAAATATGAWRLDTLARRRARAGLCPACNYDRRGIPAASVCPECGAAPAAPARAGT
jgi:hypothetical protein